MHRIRISLLAVLVLTSQLIAVSHAAEAAASLPIEHFTKYSELGDIKLSPSGGHAAYLTGKYGRTAIVVISLSTKKRTGGLLCPEGLEFYNFHWVSDERIVYELAERQPGQVRPTPTGELGAFNVDGKGQARIYGYRAGEQQTGTIIKVREASYASPEIISTSPKDEKNILIAEHPWKLRGNYWSYDPDAKPLITRLNVFNGNKSVVDRAPLADATMLADNDDQVRFAIGRNEKFELAVSWKPDANGNWKDFVLPGFDATSLVPYSLSADNKVYFTGKRDNESLSALYVLDLTTKDVAKLQSFETTDVIGVMHDLTGKKVIGARTYTDKPEIRWLNEEDRDVRLYRSLYKAFKDQTVWIESATRDGRMAIISVASDTNPGGYFLLNTETKNADFIQPVRRWVDPATMRPKTPISFKARDGLTINGYITRPISEGPSPLVVLPHGGPHGIRDYGDYDWEVQLLANRGYAVLQVNFRGSGGYGESFMKRGYGQWGASMQDDLTDATRWAIENKYAPADRICIYGASYGGYAALQGAVREPTLYRCAIGYAGVYDLELMMSSADIPRSKSGRSYLQEALGTDVERMRAFSPVNNAEKIQIPVLLIHGKEDGRADFEQAKRMKAALTKYNKKLDWMALSREGHGVYDEETRKEVYERIVSFLDLHLKGN